MTNVRRVAATCAVWGVWVAAGPLAQQADPAQAPPRVTFRAETNYVEVDAVVTDAEGNFVPGLTRDDFQVFEDRKPQEVSVLSLVNIPIERDNPPLFLMPNGSSAPKVVIEPDVATNERPLDGRIYLFVLDAYHIAPARSAEVQAKARLFIERYLGANDLAAVVHVGNPTAGQEFTSSKRLLLASVNRFMGQALNSATQDIMQDEVRKAAVDNASGRRGGDIHDSGLPEDTEAPERAMMAQQSVGALRQLAESLSTLSGRRKAVLFFSEGIGIETMDAAAATAVSGRLNTTSARQVFDAETAMIAAATRSNVSIYSIDPRGLTTGTEDFFAIAMAPAPPNPEMPSRRQALGHGDFSQAMPGLLDELHLAQQSLRAFSDRTGGRALVDVNDFDKAFRQVVEDNSSYYVLGYHSPDANRNGAYHRLGVKMTRPGLEVRTRSGYYAPSGKADAKPLDPVTALIVSPTQMSGLGMRINASVLKDSPLQDMVHLTVEFSGKDLTLTRDPRTGTFVDNIDVEYGAFDTTGRSKGGARQTVHLHLKPATQSTLADQGVRWITEFPVPPGRYQLRVAGRELTGDRTGSVFYDLIAPDFVKAKLALSDVLLSSSTVGATATGGVAPRGVSILQGLTTTSRVWQASETLTAAAEVYDNDTAHPHGVDLSATVRADDGAQVFHGEDAHAALTTDTLRYAVSIPLKTFAPGRYVLTLEAKSRLGGPTATKDIEFRVK